jgi:hypothetical protein
LLIDDFSIALSDCDLASPLHTAKVRLDVDITEMLPRVAPAVEKAEFIPEVPVLVWKESSHKYALRPREIEISNVADRDEANELVAAVVEKLNEIWAA